MKPNLSRVQLLNEFDKLDKLFQQVLILLATISKPLTQAELANLARATGWKTQAHKLVSEQINHSWCENMQRLGLLVTAQQPHSYLCNALIVEPIARKAINNQLDSEIKRVLLSKSMPYHLLNNQLEALPQWKIRLFIVNNQQQLLFDELNLMPFEQIECVYSDQFINCCDFPDDSEKNTKWFLSCRLAFQFQVLAALLTRKSLTLENSDRFFALAEKCYQQHLQQTGKHQAMFAALLAQQYLLRGQYDLVPKLLSKKSAWPIAINATLTLLKGEVKSALPLFELALTRKRQETKKRHAQLFDFENIFYLLANLAAGNSEKVKQLAGDAISRNPDKATVQLYSIFKQAVELSGNSLVNTVNYARQPQAIALSGLVDLITRYWFDGLTAIQGKITLEQSLLSAQKNNYHFFAQQALLILAKVSDKYTSEKTAIPALYQLMQPLSSEHLDANLNATDDDDSDANEVTQKAVDTRLIWWLMPETLALTPRLQKLKKDGSWTKGSALSLEKHSDLSSEDYFSKADLRIIKTINNSELNQPDLKTQSLLVAVNHPALYWPNDTQQNISVTNNAPTLFITEQGKHLKLTLQPFPEGNISVIKESAYKINLVTYTRQHKKIANILSKQGLTVPAQAKQKVLESISSIAPSLVIQTNNCGDYQHGEVIESDRRLYLQINQLDQGRLKIVANIFPLGLHGPSCKPAVGSKVIISEIQGKRQQTTRDFQKESQQLSLLAERVPVLQLDPANNNQDPQWIIDDPQLALCTLETLQTDPQVVLLWPQGKTIKLNKTVDVSNMHINVGEKTDWFELTGQLVIDESTVVPLAELLPLVSASSGRFITLKNGQYIALTEQLYQRLHGLSGISQTDNNSLVFTPLVSQSIEQISEGMQIESDASWNKQLNKVNQAYRLQPQVPANLKATLRDYQQQGFEWLSRLAHWQAGACLADDMGLGKTLQSLAVILNRAEQGPTLVLAPTSVCLNWQSEATKFAPDLRIINLAGKNRQQKIQQADKFDLLICSYGLLQTEIETLKEVQFSTIVADEAQALKNPQAKRSKAAMLLKGDFKIITTGTPIENHLAELWSLFNFINPGLLGSLESFNSQFSIAIEQGDQIAAEQLRTLIKPFILRRLKSQVLTELPARTDINLSIKADSEELAFYESCRQQAVESLKANKSQNSGKQKLQILAEITRLRQACCHPKLINSDLTISSAKQAAFIELVEELVENNHKALVFSQFVGHLALLKAELIKRNISFQYLDGSTAAKKRQQAVNDFQSGQGDLFLISLKAGGSGLNLTAADYVIHMDPWWNPAVEDQASDRAHRMGQQRPVTIYRMIMENSIEQKIMALHDQKRDLANNLLEGNEKVSGKLHVDQMLALLE